MRGTFVALWRIWGGSSGECCIGFARLRQTLSDFARPRMKAWACSQSPLGTSPTKWWFPNDGSSFAHRSNLSSGYPRLNLNLTLCFVLSQFRLILTSCYLFWTSIQALLRRESPNTVWKSRSTEAWYLLPRPMKWLTDLLCSWVHNLWQGRLICNRQRVWSQTSIRKEFPQRERFLPIHSQNSSTSLANELIRSGWFAASLFEICWLAQNSPLN